MPLTTVNGPPLDEYPDQLELSSSATGAGGTVPGTVVVAGADVGVTIWPGTPAASRRYNRAVELEPRAELRARRPKAIVRATVLVLGPMVTRAE